MLDQDVKTAIELKLRDKFWEIYNSTSDVDDKIDKWNLFNKELESLKAKTILPKLVIEGRQSQDFSLGRSVNLVNSPLGNKEVKKWNFSFPVLLKGEFNDLTIDAARFENGLEVECKFNEKGQINQYFAVNNVFFRDVEVNKTFVVSGAKFSGEVKFLGFVLINCINARIDQTTCSDIFLCSGIDLIQSSLEISDSEFENNAHFFIKSSQIGSDILLTHNKFVRDFILGINSGKAFIKELSLCNSVFNGHSIIYQMETSTQKIEQLNMDWAIFKNVMSIKLKNIVNIPDFSKTNFIDINNLSLNAESWEENGIINSSEITKNDENKFRFLKRYFAVQGNHFKENQYFAYEMAAHEKKLKNDVFSFNNAVGYSHRFLKNSSELLLFWLYKLTSNFGMSWVRPLICLFLSAFIMSIYLEDTTQHYFSFFKEFIVFRVENISYKEALLKTALPISTAREYKESLIVNLHCLVNVLFIFLLFLSLRNKFKTK